MGFQFKARSGKALVWPGDKTSGPEEAGDWTQAGLCPGKKHLQAGFNLDAQSPEPCMMRENLWGDSDVSPGSPITACVTSTWEADRKGRRKDAKTTSYSLAEAADRRNRGLLAVSTRQPFKKEAPPHPPTPV